MTATGMSCPCYSPPSPKVTLSGPVGIMRLVHKNFHYCVSIFHPDVQVSQKGARGWRWEATQLLAVVSLKDPKAPQTLSTDSFWPGGKAPT